MDIFESFLVVGQKTGDFSIVKIGFEGGELKMKKSRSTIGHLRAVICADFMRYDSNELFLSGG